MEHPLSLDHILWATSDLALGIATFEHLTGVRPIEGGEHEELGTCNAMVSLGKGRYLSIIAPLPGKAEGGNLGEIIATSAEMVGPTAASGWLSFAMKSDNLENMAQRAKKQKLSCIGPFNSIRTNPRGQSVRWKSLFTLDTPFGGHLPFYIDWGNEVHPSTTSPTGIELLEFKVYHDKPAELQAIYDAMGVGIPVRSAQKPKFKAVFMSPAGQVEL